MEPPMDRASFELRQKKTAQDRADIARAFWRKFVERNAGVGLFLELNPDTGLPKNCSDAYRAAFDPKYSGAVGSLAQARKFQRALMRL